MAATTLVIVLAMPAIGADGGTVPFARAGEVPESRFYARIDEIEGRAQPRWRRKRDGEFQVDELSDGTVLRVRRIVAGDVIEDHRYDAGGWPLVTVFFGPGGLPDHAVIHAVPEQSVPLSSWTFHSLPDARGAGPSPPVDLPGGSVRLQALDGELDVWTGATADPWSDGFRDGLVAGCGCTIGDRAAAWVDGRPGVRYRLLVPDAGPPRPVDLWAVPQGEGMWLATFRAGALPTKGDPDAALLAGRVLLALVSFDTEPT